LKKVLNIKKKTFGEEDWMCLNTVQKEEELSASSSATPT